MSSTDSIRWVAGCDYLRLTFTSAAAEELALPWYQATVGEWSRRSGFVATDTRPWAWRGYVGSQAGAAAWGLREDGAILQMSGQAAAWGALRDLPYTGVPRLDVQCTVWGQAQPEGVPRAAAAASERARKGAIGRPWRIRFEDGHGAGDTAYLGSRASAWFIRIYDKGAESGEAQYAGSVRYEVEMHDEHATKVYGSRAREGMVGSTAASIVRGYLVQRGVEETMPVSVGYTEPARLPREETPTERTLNWLGEGVAPTIARLLGAGLTRQALCGILGL